MSFRFDIPSLAETLPMTAKGMVGIFVVIGVIMLVIKLLNLSANKRGE